MVRLVMLGLVAAAFFSSTFILNRAMSLAGGHWIWTASLRYGWMLILLSGWLACRSGPRSLVAVARVLRAHWRFWLLVGTVGFGCFYAPLCFAAAYAPAWVVASTWQSTILATPIVLLFFGRRVPTKGIVLSALIFIGILLVNLEHAGEAGVRALFLGIAPVLLAAVAYPVGNQLVGEAKAGKHRNIPHIADPIMSSAPARVLLMTLGSLPFWVFTIALVRPPAPSGEQYFNTALVALLSGVIATSIYLHARHSTSKPYAIAAVDATQAGETVFSLAGEVLFLAGSFPHVSGSVGLLFIVLGIVLYTTEQAAHR